MKIEGIPFLLMGQYKRSGRNEPIEKELTYG